MSDIRRYAERLTKLEQENERLEADLKLVQERNEMKLKEAIEFIDRLDDGAIMKNNKHPKCLLEYDEWNGDYDCGYDSTLDCDDCKYGMGKKDPEEKCNQRKEQG